MKKHLRIFSILVIAALIFSFSGMTVWAAAAFTLPKTNTAPAIDGKLDDTIYTKMHDFYGIEGFTLDADPDKKITGSVYATWDDKNLYVFTVVDAQNHDSTSPAIDMGEGTVGYLAVLATAPGAGWTDNSRFEIGSGVKNDGTQEWKTCSPADIKDSSDGGGTDFWQGKCPFEFKCIRDEAAKKTYYEWAVPWTFLDRTNTISFKEGHQITFNYAYNVHTRDEYIAGTRQVVELGGGIWTGGYEDGMIITLGTAPAAPEAPADPAEPEPAAPAKEAAPEAKTQSPKTGDHTAALAALLVLSAIAGSTVLAKRKAK